MRFMVMHKVGVELKEGDPIPQDLVQGMGTLIQESLKKGIFKNGAGLKGSKYRTRLQFRGGEVVASKEGPYAGTHELLAGFVMLEVKTKEEALGWAKRFGKLRGEADVELGVVTEPWDIGVMPKPTGPVPLHFLLLNMADQQSEAGNPPSESEVKAMAALMDEMSKAGVLQSGEAVRPSSQAVRLQFKGGKRTVIDGPFTESKELIAGFSIIDLPTREEALVWTDRYAAILGDVEVDLLRLHEV